jgi:hypothetical protein
MRLVILLFVLSASCGDDAQPIDAPVEHMIPTDLGTACGPSAGCFATSDKTVGSICHERCSSIGNFPAICTTTCSRDSDCGPGAPHCTAVADKNLCMAMTGDPNAGCQNPVEAGMPIDAAFRDAPAIDAGSID